DLNVRLGSNQQEKLHPGVCTEQGTGEQSDTVREEDRVIPHRSATSITIIIFAALTLLEVRSPTTRIRRMTAWGRSPDRPTTMHIRKLDIPSMKSTNWG